MTRRTEQRAAIRRAIADAGRPLTAPELLEAAQWAVPGLGIATVYRTLKALVDEHFVRVVDLPGEPARYELAASDHHHHFQCDDCGRVFDVPGCVHGIASLVPDGFAVRSHEIVFYGRCGDCG